MKKKALRNIVSNASVFENLISSHMGDDLKMGQVRIMRAVGV